MPIEYTGPKGTRDFLPGEMEIRVNVITKIQEVFKKYGFYMWDGPAFEHLETFTRKSGETVSDEVYVFKDKGGRDLALRFELTTSLARLIASNPKLLFPIKAYSYGKVWRYENPQKGRYREFLQMDADIFGSSHMVCELELLNMANEILQSIGFDNYYMNINNRKILEGLIRLAEISDDWKNDVLRSFDKLLKIGLEGVKDELRTKGLSGATFDNFMKNIITEGSNEEKIKHMKNVLKDDPKGLEGVNELEFIVNLSNKSDLGKKIQIDYTLVRGLDYYTGPIFEIKIKDSETFGSISGGGRYDKLVGTYGSQDVPAVGLSFGIERIIDIISNNPNLAEKFEKKPPKIMVVLIKDNLLEHALDLLHKIRDANISADIDVSMRPLKRQMEYANKMGYPYIIVVGAKEVESKQFNLKNMKTGEETPLSIEQIIYKLKE